MPKEEGGTLEQRRPIYEIGHFVIPSSRPLDEPTTDDPRHGDSRDQEEEDQLKGRKRLERETGGQGDFKQKQQHEKNQQQQQK